MENRIRHIRRLRGLTLKEVAERAGTTPQTISRLETSVMGLSTDWLARLAAALGVRQAELLDEAGTGAIPFVGIVGPDGIVSAEFADDQDFAFRIPAEHPLAVRMESDCGPYRRGEIVLASRSETDDLSNCWNHDCIVETRDGALLLRRLVEGDAGRAILVGLDSGAEVRHGAELAWAARIVMRITCPKQ